jgi:hypothetical protein
MGLTGPHLLMALGAPIITAGNAILYVGGTMSVSAAAGGSCRPPGRVGVWSRPALLPSIGWAGVPGSGSWRHRRRRARMWACWRARAAAAVRACRRPLALPI